MELEATKSLLKEKEEKPYNKLEHGSDLQNIKSDEASHEDEMNTLTLPQEVCSRNLSLELWFFPLLLPFPKLVNCEHKYSL